VADIHDRMPVILAPSNYACWLGEEPDPRELMRPFPADLMRMWPISTRVNKPFYRRADCVGIRVPDRRNRQLAVAHDDCCGRGSSTAAEQR
jgi:hypothetical protein